MILRNLMVRLLLAFGLTQALWLMTSPTPLVQAGGLVTDCSNDAQFSSLLAGGGTVTFNCGTALINLSSTQTIGANTMIDGAGKITLSGQNARQLFLVSSGASLTLRNVVLTKGFSSDGGAIFNNGVLILENSTIRNCNAIQSGGAIVSYGPLTVTGSLLEGNRALNGGALLPLFLDARTTIVNSVLRDNHATDTTNGWGGAIFAFGSVPMTIEGSDIISNSGNFGGGVYNDTGTATLTNVTLNGNSSGFNGGGLYNNSGTATLTNVTFSENSTGNNGNGGGLYNFSGTATLTNVTLSGNSAIRGGGVYNSGTATLTNVTLSGNSSVSGGGFRNDDGTATLTNVTLSGNSSEVAGGGLYNFNGMATLTNVTLSGNSAASFGGGFYNFSGTATLTNVTLSGNTASRGGGILHFSFISGRILSLKNSIVANSPAGGNCFKEANSVTSITSSGFNLSSDNSCTSYFNQAGDQNNKPAQLGPLANNGGFTLTHLPLPPIVNGTGPIDNGSCPVSFDQRGVSRPQGLACDIGAVEYRQGELTPWLYLPLIEK